MTRPSWDQYFLDIAEVVATRGTCDRRAVGAVIVKDNRIIATGYNSAREGKAHCDDVGHEMQDGHCARTIHAEISAVSQVSGMLCRGETIYVTCKPCEDCVKVLARFGITDIVYP